MLIEVLDRLSRVWRYVTVLALFIAIGSADFVTSYEYTFASLYLIPIVFAGWLLGRRPAIAVALVCGVFWFSINYATERGSHLSVAVWNAGTRVLLFFIAALAASAARTLLDRERSLSRTDYITGALNGRAFYEVCEREVERARRYGSPFSLVIIDVDDFKRVNDERGHRAGDDVLKQVAQLMRDALRRSDTVARLGGDEFGALLAETGEEEAAIVVDRLMRRTAYDSAPLSEVTFSAGVVTCVTPPESVDEVISFADHLMYAAKRTGKNRFMSEVFRAHAAVAGVGHA